MMRNIFRESFEKFDTYSFIRILKIFTLYATLVLLYAFVYSGFQIVDEFEHLHASWLVSLGKLPYKDFFEHHHPLLWYISAPIVSFFYDNVSIFYIMRGISSVISILTLWYIYKISLFWGNKSSAWFAIAIILCDIITVYNFSQFRPDNFMNLSFIMGLYYWFDYVHRHKRVSLIYSFLSFTFSVLFLQKISLLLIAVEVLILFLLYKRYMTIKDTTLAAIPALICLFIFLFFLYSKDILIEYIELNLHFNQALVYYFKRGAFWYRHIFFSIYTLGLVTAIYFFNKENLYFKLIAVLYICEFLMRGFYFAPHPNYYTLMTMLLGLILSVYAKILMPKHKLICIAVIISIFLRLGNTFDTLERASQMHDSYQHYKLAEYVHKNSTSTDYLMNGYDMNFNIYRQDVSYYWFGLDMLLPVMEQEYDLKEKIDINVLVLQYRPKFIYTQNYMDLRAFRSYGEYKFSQQYIPEIIQHFYTETPFQDLVILK